MYFSKEYLNLPKWDIKFMQTKDVLCFFQICKTILSDVHIQYSVYLFSKVMPVFVTTDWEYSFISPATLQFSAEKEGLRIRLRAKGSLWIVLYFLCFHNLLIYILWWHTRSKNPSHLQNMRNNLEVPVHP